MIQDKAKKKVEIISFFEKYGLDQISQPSSIVNHQFKVDARPSGSQEVRLRV